MSAESYSLLHNDLKALDQFCVRVQKQPYIASDMGGGFSSSSWSTRREDWLTFSEAMKALDDRAEVFFQKGMAPVEGIGFLVARSGDGPQTLGGDLDTCRDPETGFIGQWARDFIKAVRPFYTEVSLSGCGLRYFCWGRLPGGRDKVFGNGPDDLPEDVKQNIIKVKPAVAEKIAKGENAFNGLEFYETGRHLTLTGRRIDEMCYAKEDQSQAIEIALAPYIINDVITKIEGEVGRISGNRLPKLNILDVIDTNGFTDAGGQLLGPHPTQGSATGKNLVVNPSKNIYCWMHDGINAGGDPWIWLACECGALHWAAAGAGMLRDPVVLKRTIEHAVRRGLVKDEDVKRDDKPGIRPVTTERNLGYAGLHEDGTIRVVDLEPKDAAVKRLKWVSDCAVYIATETVSSDGNTEFIFKGEGARDHRKVCFTLRALDLHDGGKFKAAMINAFGAANKVGKLNFEMVQDITVNTIKKRRIEAPTWDKNIPLVPGMNLADDVEYKLSSKTPVDVYDGDLSAAKHALRDLLSAHKYAPILVTTVMGAPAFARWHGDDRFGLGLWGTTGTMKTSMVQAAMSVFGTGYLEDIAILKHGEAGGTLVGRLEVFVGSGVMAQLLDNIKTVDPKDAARYIAIIHAVLEGGEKVRGQKDRSGIRDSKAYKCTPIITGEVKPEEASTSARVLNLDWSRPDEDKLADVQSNVAILPVIGYKWLQFLAETELDLVGGFNAARMKYMGEFTKERYTNPGRLATIFVLLKATWRLLCASPMGDVFSEFTEEFDGVLSEAIQVQGKAVTDETEVSRFLHGIRELIASAPHLLESENEENRLSKVIGKRFNDGSIFLMPKLTLTELMRINNFSQMPTATSISKDLNQMGLLRKNDSPHLQAKQTVGGEQVRGWWMVSGWDNLSHSKKSGMMKTDDGGSNFPKNPESHSKISTNLLERGKKDGINHDKSQISKNNQNGGIGGIIGNEIERDIDIDIDYSSSSSIPQGIPHDPKHGKRSTVIDVSKKRGKKADLITLRITADCDFEGNHYRKDDVVGVVPETASELPGIVITPYAKCVVCKKHYKTSSSGRSGGLCNECRKNSTELVKSLYRKECTACGKIIHPGRLISKLGECEVCYWEGVIAGKA